MAIIGTQANQTWVDFVRFDSEENAGDVAEMERIIAAWEEDHSCPDLYCLPKSSE